MYIYICIYIFTYIYQLYINTPTHICETSMYITEETVTNSNHTESKKERFIAVSCAGSPRGMLPRFSSIK